MINLAKIPPVRAPAALKEEAMAEGETVVAEVKQAEETKGEPTCQSPPAAGMPAREEVDPRTQLHQLARELVRTHNRRALVEYLRLRRTLR